MAERTVVVTDIQMPFFSMVWFLVKWTLASIPAMLILGLILGAFWVVVAMLFGGAALVASGG